jgi:hypothetical protein
VYILGYIPRQLATLDGPLPIYAHNTDIAWVAYRATTTPWRWQPFAETCQGKIWNALIKSTSSLMHLFVILQWLQQVQLLYSWWILLLCGW